jgi:hypothetical protein
MAKLYDSGVRHALTKLCACFMPMVLMCGSQLADTVQIRVPLHSLNNSHRLFLCPPYTVDHAACCIERERFEPAVFTSYSDRYAHEGFPPYCTWTSDTLQLQRCLDLPSHLPLPARVISGPAKVCHVRPVHTFEEPFLKYGVHGFLTESKLMYGMSKGNTQRLLRCIPGNTELCFSLCA